MKMNLIEIGVGMKSFPNFRMSSYLGEIVDLILNDDETIFDEIFFPKLTYNAMECILHNPETQNALRISNEGPFLTVKTPKYLEEDLIIQLIRNFQKNVAERMMRDFKLKRVHQIGIMKRFRLDNVSNKALEQFAAKIGHKNASLFEYMVGGNLDRNILKAPKNAIGFNLVKIVKTEGLNLIDFIVDTQIRFPEECDSVSEIDFVYLNNCNATIIDTTYKAWANENFGN